MAEYKGIKGFKVQSHASDPTANEGQIWYNTASYALKYDAVGAGSWSSAPAVNTARRSMMGTGTTTAAVIAGGLGPYSTATETYNGSAWSTSPATLTTGTQYNKGDGSSTAAIQFAGVIAPSGALTGVTETFNGSAWTASPASLNTARQGPGNSTLGSTTASLCVGGQLITPGAGLDLTETFDGSTWTEVNDLNTSRKELGGAGTSTACLAIGGMLTPPSSTGITAVVETWDGTSWSEVNPLNGKRVAAGSAGSNTAAMLFGGTSPADVATTEIWDGSTWTEVADLATARNSQASAGASNQAALSISGYNGSNLTIVEEWDGAPAVVKTVTVS
jgi:hypothetical protein